MGKIEQFPIVSSPMPAVARILSCYDRRKVEAFIEVAIGLLDTFDAPDDPDVPDFSLRSDGQPGCPLDHELGGDAEAGAYVEWTSMRVAQQRRGLPVSLGDLHEDDELIGDETDASGAEDEECPGLRRKENGAGCPIADPGGCEHDGHEDEGGKGFGNYAIDQTRPPLPENEALDRRLMRPHRDWIRKNRCTSYKIRQWGGDFETVYRLMGADGSPSRPTIS